MNMPCLLPRFLCGAALGVCCAALSLADEYRVEVLTEAPPAEGVAPAIHQQLASTGLKVIRGSNRTVCEIWPCRKWRTDARSRATADQLYPFQVGELFGLLRFRRRGNDFRDQQISRGLYTLRYGLQPIDGNHEGTSPTRDFLLLLKATDDDAESKWTVEALMEASAAAAQSNHPAMLCLQQATATRTAPLMKHDEDKDWWILQWVGQSGTGESVETANRALPVDLVVVGHAEE